MAVARAQRAGCRRQTVRWCDFFLSRAALAPSHALVLTCFRMLFAFWEKDKSKGGKLQALMFLGGEHTEGGLRFMIVPEVEAEAAAANFSSLSSRHIYSLQRTLPKAGHSSDPLCEGGERAREKERARGDSDAVETQSQNLDSLSTTGPIGIALCRGL